MTKLSDCSILHKLDVLSSINLLKINKESNYRTRFGGLMTIIFIAIIIIIFAFRLRARINGQLMSYTTRQIYDSSIIGFNSASHTNSSFMRAFLMDGITFQVYDHRHFQVQLAILKKKQQIYSAKTYSFQPCQQQEKDGRQWYWSDFCSPIINETLNVQSDSQDIYSANHQYIQIVVTKCNPLRRSDCIDIDLKTKSINFQFYYFNNIFSLDQLDYKKTYLYHVRIPIDSWAGSSAEINLSKYKIKTDRSYLRIPESIPVQQEGYFQEKSPSINRGIYSNKDVISKIFIQRSTATRIIQRKDHTIIDILAYIGGLSTTFLAVIQIVVNVYNQYAFEIQLGQKLYNKNQKQQQQKQNKQDQNKGKISLFCDWIKNRLCCFCITNQQTQQYRSQLNKQINIENILRKLNIFQNILLYLVTTTKLRNELNDLKKYSIKQAEKFRNIFDVFEKTQSQNQQKQNEMIKNKDNKEVNVHKNNENIQIYEHHQKSIRNEKERQQARPLDMNDILFQQNYQSHQQINKRQQNHQKIDNNFKKDQINMNENIINEVDNEKLQSDNGLHHEDRQQMSQKQKQNRNKQKNRNLKQFDKRKRNNKQS